MKALFGVIVICCSQTLHADAKLRTQTKLGSEFLFPTHENRQIETITFNFMHVWERWPEHPFTFGTGLSVTGAKGRITQHDDNWQEIVSDTQAVGLGPVFRVKYEPIVYRGFSPGIGLWGGLILYSDHFPPGGDVYNFMWRSGISLNYRSGNGRSFFSLSWKWMHVSNGQGITDRNPSYEAEGLGFSWGWYLD